MIKKKKKDSGEVLLRVIIFGSFRFLSKKIIKPKSVQTDRFWFGFLGQKPVQTSLTHFGLFFFRFG